MIRKTLVMIGLLLVTSPVAAEQASEEESDEPIHFGVDDEEGWDEEDEGGGESRGEESFASGINPWPLFEISVIAAPILRLFRLPIDRNIDGDRSLAHFESKYFGNVGFHISLFPFARFDAPAIRGLGVEVSAAFGVGLDFSISDERSVAALYDELDLSLVYILVLGRRDVGGHLLFRLGWHQTNFYLGNIGNDIIAPFEYDSFRIDIGARVPLRTRHILAELRGAYLFTPSIGPDAAQAYSAAESPPSSHAAELRAGLLFRVGGLELAVLYISRWFITRFEGLGFGYGEDPSTKLSTGGNGIQTTEPAMDQFQQIRLSLGYRW